jgi:peptide/nickel transport system substrate-binding protein
MKKFLLVVFVSIFLIGGIAVIGFSQSKAGIQPQSGGTLRCIRNSFPKIFYSPEMGPTDNMFAIPIAERLCVWDEKGNLIPELAEKWKVDQKNKTITWYIRKGILFHDGSPLDAEAVKWNYQQLIDGGRLPDGKLVDSLEVIDKYTIRMRLKEYNALLIMNYGWVGIYSPTAFKTNGGKEWARTHAVGTGPYKLADFKRDVSIRYEKNKEYWRKGYPLLDAIEIRYIPDNSTALMLMQTKEADMWMNATDVKKILELQGKGLKVTWGAGMFMAILPNGKDPKLPYANKKVREAIEYAIDRPALAKSIGFGQFEPLQQMAPEASPAYIKGFNPRPYNPEKAKQLLAAAGYPNGFETKMLSTDRWRDLSTALQSYLAAVGIRVTVDTADMGRYFGAVFTQGWNDLALSVSGINPDATDLFVHFGTAPMTYRTGNIPKTKEFLDLCNKGLHTYDTKTLKNLLQQIVKKGSEDAMIIPIYRTAEANVTQSNVHSDYLKIHTTMWLSYKEWLEKSK